MPPPRVSVVIPLWKGRDHIPACLASLEAQTLRDHEVVVVDNAWPDGAAAWVEQHHPGVRLLRQERNLGFAGGTNAGIRAARGEHIVTLNQDTVCDPRFLEELVAGLGWGERVGMVACKMRYFHDPTVLNSTGIRVLGDGFAEDRGGYERDEGQWDEPGEVFGPCAGAALYARAMLDEVGLFDEDFFAYFEDTDLAWRARIAGWRCVYNPRAEVRHKHRGSETQVVRETAVPRQVLLWCERNRAWMVLKNMGLSTMLLRAPVLLGREAYALAEAARLRDGGKLRARAEALAMLGPTLAKRRRVQALRRVPERELRAWMRGMPLLERAGRGSAAPGTAAPR